MSLVTNSLQKKKLVVHCLERMQLHALIKTKRADQSQKASMDERNNSFEDFEWTELYEENKLEKLLVLSLNTFLAHHQ